ncbi:MAG: hypothetical protein FD146_1560 [Anaerolineaceae bacterium]|nr:MAG: hypothetical protein FD146_1560 [Anaerolineaceae bacterium]
MIFVVLLGLAAGGLTIAAGLSEASRTRVWADVSIIWMLAPALLFALAGVAVLAGMIYAVARLTRVTPRFTSRAQQVAGQAAAATRKAADGITKPFVWLQQAGAVLKSIFKL